jgi:hypothetical protein
VKYQEQVASRFARVLPRLEVSSSEVLVVHLQRSIRVKQGLAKQGRNPVAENIRSLLHFRPESAVAGSPSGRTGQVVLRQAPCLNLQVKWTCLYLVSYPLTVGLAAAPPPAAAAAAAALEPQRTVELPLLSPVPHSIPRSPSSSSLSPPSHALHAS